MNKTFIDKRVHRQKEFIERSLSVCTDLAKTNRCQETVNIFIKSAFYKN